MRNMLKLESDNVQLICNRRHHFTAVIASFRTFHFLMDFYT